MIVKQNEGFVKKYFHEKGDFSEIEDFYEMGDFSRAFIISVSSFRFLFPRCCITIPIMCALLNLHLYSPVPE